MSDIITRIDSMTRSASFVGWKFAANGQWDRGQLAYFKREGGQLVEPVLRWLDEQHASEIQDIAFKATFAIGNEDFFIGVRLTHLSLEEKRAVIRRLISSGQPDDTFAQVVAKVRDCLDDQSLFSGTPDFLELGVFDFWHKVQGLRVWKSDTRLGAKSEIILPEEFPDNAAEPEEGYKPLYEPQPNPLMLKAGWIGRPFPHWIGMPISKKTSKGFVVAEERYFNAATAYVGRNFIR